jgi:hypothetical protein
VTCRNGFGKTMPARAGWKKLDHEFGESHE